MTEEKPKPKSLPVHPVIARARAVVKKTKESQQSICRTDFFKEMESILK